MRSLTEGLKNNMTLESLNLSKNESHKSFKEFARILAHSSLKTLDLSYNSISDDDGILLAQALVPNRWLESISLKNNLFRDSAGREFSICMKQNMQIIKFDISENNVKYQSMLEIKDYCARNQSYLISAKLPGMKQEL